MAKISVIIPIYNVEDYLSKCLDSITNQTFKDLEIICVNDGSKDNSLQILENYAAKDNRIKIIDKQNGGLSSARNAGLEVATSEWISFIDSDDWLDTNAYEKLAKLFEKNPDIICFGTHLRGEVPPEIANNDAQYYKIKHKGFVKLTDKIRLTTDVGTWNKLYKKSIIDKFHLRFPIGKHYEDYPFYWEYMFESQTAFYVEEKFYNYLRRPNSIMANTFNKKSEKVIDHLYASEIIFDYLKERNILKEHLETFAEIFMNCFWFAFNLSPKKIKKRALFQATDLLNKFSLGNDFNDKHNIINFLKAGQYYKINGIEYDKNIWQKIFSIKNRNGKKIIKILGIKFTKRNKIKALEADLKLDIKNTNDEINNLKWLLQNLENEVNSIKQCNYIKSCSFWNDNHYVVCNSLYDAFVRQVDTKQFYKMACEFFAGKDLQNIPNWDALAYISALIENNQIDLAKKVLNEYVSMKGDEDIYRFITVAKFAKENGITNEEIEKANLVYQKLEECHKRRILEKFIKGKSVAIVGNGPSEIGKGKGAEIDSHDIVIRFNNYEIDGHENDYGSRTDIWVKCSSDDIKHEVRDKNIKLLLYEPDYFHHAIIDGYLDVLCDNNIAIDYFDFEEHVSLRRKLKIFPSTGLVTIEKVLNCNAVQIDCYGFSFLQEKQDNYATHYYNDRSENEARQRSAHHSFDKETEYLKKVLQIQ